MSRPLAYALVLVMLLTVLAQGVKLATLERRSMDEIVLHESRLVPVLQQIRAFDSETYDSTVLNLARIRPDRIDRFQHEEIVIAERLLERLARSGP